MYIHLMISLIVITNIDLGRSLPKDVVLTLLDWWSFSHGNHRQGILSIISKILFSRYIFWFTPKAILLKMHKCSIGSNYESLVLVIFFHIKLYDMIWLYFSRKPLDAKGCEHPHKCPHQTYLANILSHGCTHPVTCLWLCVPIMSHSPSDIGMGQDSSATIHHVLYRP